MDIKSENFDVYVISKFPGLVMNLNFDILFEWNSRKGRRNEIVLIK